MATWRPCLRLYSKQIKNRDFYFSLYSRFRQHVSVSELWNNKVEIKQCVKSVRPQKKVVRTDKCFTVLTLFVNCTVGVTSYSARGCIS